MPTPETTETISFDFTAIIQITHFHTAITKLETFDRLLFELNMSNYEKILGRWHDFGYSALKREAILRQGGVEMWPHSDRPFEGVDKRAAAAEFIFAAERLILRDVRPELLPENDRATIEYFLECLSKKFSDSNARVNISRVLHNAIHIDDDH